MFHCWHMVTGGKSRPVQQVSMESSLGKNVYSQLPTSHLQFIVEADDVIVFSSYIFIGVHSYSLAKTCVTGRQVCHISVATSILMVPCI